MQCTHSRSHLNMPITTLELQSESETAIIAHSFPLAASGIIANIIAIAMPPKVLLVGSLLRVHNGFHANIIKTIWLKQVDDIESILHILASIAN